MQSKKYTVEELQIIANEVALYPTNLQLAFHSAADKLGRSSDGVMYQYYAKLKKQKQALIATGSSHGIIVNVKNTPRPKNQTSFALSIIELSINQINKEEALELVKTLIKKFN